jgi:hypothetical protein
VLRAFEGSGGFEELVEKSALVCMTHVVNDDALRRFLDQGFDGTAFVSSANQASVGEVRVEWIEKVLQGV